MKHKLPILILVTVLMVLTYPDLAFGFGVSPPWVKSDHLLRGSHLEQTIYLVQSDPKTDYRAEVEFSLEASKIKDWLTIDSGMEFVIPAGVQKFPLKITVDVPQDAELGEYKGYIWISGKPEKEGQVTTVAGGTIELALKITDKEFSDWILRDLGIRNLGKDEKTIKVYLRVENLGNVKTRPSKVRLDVYDNYHQKLLMSGEDADLEWIPPFQIKEIAAEFSVSLIAVQQYWGKIEIYKGDELLLADKRRFNVGEIPTTEKKQEAVGLSKEEPKEGFGFGFLKNKIFLFILLGIVLLAGLGFGVRQIKKSGLGLEIKLKQRKKKKS